MAKIVLKDRPDVNAVHNCAYVGVMEWGGVKIKTFPGYTYQTLYPRRFFPGNEDPGQS